MSGIGVNSPVAKYPVSASGRLEGFPVRGAFARPAVPRLARQAAADRGLWLSMRALDRQLTASPAICIRSVWCTTPAAGPSRASDCGGPPNWPPPRRCDFCALAIAKGMTCTSAPTRETTIQRRLHSVGPRREPTLRPGGYARPGPFAVRGRRNQPGQSAGLDSGKHPAPAGVGSYRDSPALGSPVSRRPGQRRGAALG